MSADGQEDTGNLNKGEESPTATQSQSIPVSSTFDEKVVRSQTNPEQTTPVAPTSKSGDSIDDNTETNEDVETKLPVEKDKGLDVDSELDFELKWDDDAELSEDLLDDTGKIESTPSVDEGLDSTSKNTEETNSIDKELKWDDDEDLLDDTGNIESKPSVDEGLDSTSKNTEDPNSIDMELKWDDNASLNKDLLDDTGKVESTPSVDEGLDSTSKNTEDRNSIGKELKWDDDASLNKDLLDDTGKVESTPSVDEGLDSTSKNTEEPNLIDNDLDSEKDTEISTDEGLDSVTKDLSSMSNLKDDDDKRKTLDIVEKEVETALTSIDKQIDEDKEILTAIDKDISDGGKDNDSNKFGSVKEDEVVQETLIKPNADTFENDNITLDIDPAVKISPNGSEANSLDEELVYSDAEVPDIEDNDLLNEIDSQLTSIKDNICELETIDTKVIQALPVATGSQEDCKKDEQDQGDHVKEMDIDSNLISSNNVAGKSSLDDTAASVTDMETSYDVNNEHKLDRPDVMLEIPTQELIDTFDDIPETDTTLEGKDKLKQSIDGTDIVQSQSGSEYDPKNTTDTTLEEKSKLKQSLDGTDIVQSQSGSENDPKNTTDTTLEEKDKLKKSVDETDMVQEPSSKDDPKNTSDELIKDKVQAAVDTKKSEDVIAESESMDVDISANTEEVIKPGKEDSDVKESPTDTEKQNSKLALSELSETDIISEAKSELPQTLDLDKSATEETVDKGEEETSINENIETLESKAKDSDAAQPSTSKDHQELSDEDQEATDSLGLLAESSRVMDDEDEQEPENDEDDDDDDFDQDEESNQMTVDHSEDSNAQHSESDVPKESMDVDESNDTTEAQVDATTELEDAETGNDDQEVFDDANVDESSTDKGDFQIQIEGIASEVVETKETEELEQVETIAETTDIETEKAVEALLQDKPAEEVDIPEPAAQVEEVKMPEDFSAIQKSKLRALLLKDSDSSNDTSEAEQKSPSITKTEIPKQDINIVELEESSSDDDVQVYKPDEPKPPSPKEVTVSTTEVSASEEVSTDLEKEVSVKPGEKAVKLDAELKTASPIAVSSALPDTVPPKSPETKTPADLGEIFSLDSDDEDTAGKGKRKKKPDVETDKAKETNHCINEQCSSDASVPLVPASSSASIYYAANSQRGNGLCLNCAQRFEDRSKKLIEGVKDFTPYLSMDMCVIREELVEISDSDSEDEACSVKKDDEIIGEKGAKLLEEQLAGIFNETWKKYDMEARLLAAQEEIGLEVRQLEEECMKIDAILHDCQIETDKLRNNLYDTFADERRELPSVCIVDTPYNQWSGLEEAAQLPVEYKEPRQTKRHLSTPPEPAAKRPAIPLGYASLDDKEPQDKKRSQPAEVPPGVEDDSADIAVVKLSVESAPAGLPPPGVPTRPPLKPNMYVYAMRNTFGAWHKVKIVEVQPKITGQFTMCRVRFEHPKSTSKVLPARCLAYEHAPDVRLTIGTRVVALFKDHRNLEDLERKEAYYSGIVAEIPNPVNSFRYLIFFDDGYAQYVQHAVTRLVCECAPRVWDEVHPLSRQFVRDYLRAYPERPMVRLHAGQSIKTEWNGKWWPSTILQVDASLVHVLFDGKKEAGVDKTEWIYRGSTRLAPLFLELQAAERQRARPLPRAQAARRFNMPYVEYTRSDEAPARPAPAAPPTPTPAHTQAQIEQEIKRQRAVAKKSTQSAAAPPPQPVRENVTSRVVYYSPKNAIKPHPWVPHTCSPRCRRNDVLALRDLRTYNPLTKPLLSGWERHTLRFRAPQSKTAMYRAPCGRRIRNHKELHQYLQAIESDMSVDLFDFNGHTHCLAEFVLNKCIVSKKDLSHGKENVPVPCVNYYDDSLPEFCSYNTERTPTAGVPLNLDPDFLCGCDCTDDCADKSKCACWKMTLEGARTIGLDAATVGYVYKRLPEPLPSGIYECNSRCKCRQTCLNRVAQHPLQLKLQVFKTANRGWGIRALNDVPKGAFLCVYAGNLLTDATANLDGLNEGDEYLAELDYIEVVEQMKEGFEEDIVDPDRPEDDEEEESQSSEEEPAREADDDFRPALPTGRYPVNEYSKRLRKRDKTKKGNEEKEKKAKEEKKSAEDCITISDDEELREPARFAAQTGMGGKEFVSKYKSVRTLFGKDEACYIMDAKVQGNIGRYLNHSCTPNVFVQNVFVDTHDPRFPWVAFFALSHIKAGTELTWNYNYDVGSVPGKVLYCYCNAPNCRGRLL